MTYPISDVTRRVVYSGSLGTGPYPFLFEILTSADIGVYKNTTLLTLSADYTVTINADGTGSVTLSSAATSTDTISIFGNKGIQRQTDFTTGGDLFANSLNDELDAQTIFAQQNSEAILRSIRAPVTDPTTVDMILPSASSRADSVLTFDTNGDVQATSTSTFVAGLSGSILGANYVTNNATGDGSTTAFTVSVAAGSKTNIQIYIDGVYQNKASFSVSGTTVTFTEAPPLNSSIEFMIGFAIGSATGAASIDFTQAGTGAVTRTVESKLQDVVSVKDFGAVGDGVTDDTAAIQAAIDYIETIGRGSLLFPSGQYSLSSQITVDDCDIYIKGSGVDVTNLVWSNSSGGILFTDTTGVSAEDRSTFTIKDITLSTSYASGGTALSFNYSVASPVVPFGDASTVKISNVDIRGLDFYGGNTDYWTTGINLLDAGGIYIADCRILGKANIAGTKGIILKSQNSSVVRAMLTGIQILFAERAFNIEGSSGNSIEGIYLTNYEFVACSEGIYISGGVVHALEINNGHIDAETNCIYQNDPSARGSSTCKIINNYLQLGNKWSGSYSTGNVISLDRVQYASIIGNYIFGDPAKSVTQNGVLMDSCDYGTVSANQFYSLNGGILFGDNGTNGDCIGSKADSSNTYKSITINGSVTGTSSYIASEIMTSNTARLNTDSGFQLRTSNQIVTLNASGEGTITYPTAFSTDTIAAIISNNDSSALGGGQVFNVDAASSTSTTLSFDVKPNPGAVTVNVSYIAIGY